MAPPALGLGLRLSAPLTLSGLDPDAKAYIAAVETALSSSITADQKNAINDFIKTGKSAGWYSSIKRFYLPIWADAAANAIDMVTRTSGTFTATGVTHASGYVQGDGSTGYFTSDNNPHAVGMSSSTGGLVALVKTAPTGAGFAAMGGVAGATTAVQLYHNADIVVGTVAGNPPTVFYSGSRATNTGVWMTSRTAVNALSLFQRSASGFFTRDFDALDVTGNSATTVNMTFMSQTGAIPSDAEFGAYGMILGLSTANATAFTLALKNLWETASGLSLDPDAAAYVSALRSAGATVTSTQESAIHTFITTGKADGWYSSLKRLYLPIWADAAANAIDMISRTSGTFSLGGVDHSNVGYVQGDGSTGYFDVGSSMASHGLTRASGWFGAIMVTAVANHQYLGAQNSTTEVELLRHTAAPGITTDYNDAFTGRNSSLIATTGIISASRFSGVMKHFRRTASSRVEAGSFTYADTGSMTSLNCYAIAKNASGVATSSSTSQMGGWWFGTGVTAAQDERMTLALKNLWETASNLTLPS